MINDSQEVTDYGVGGGHVWRGVGVLTAKPSCENPAGNKKKLNRALELFFLHLRSGPGQSLIASRGSDFEEG